VLGADLHLDLEWTWERRCRLRDDHIWRWHSATLPGQLVLLTTFASVRWGEVSALARADLDLKARTVRIRAAYVERSTGPLVLGPPKSQAGRRIVGIPAAIVPDLERHLAVYVKRWQRSGRHLRRRMAR
jgi:integrase